VDKSRTTLVKSLRLRWIYKIKEGTQSQEMHFEPNLLLIFFFIFEIMKRKFVLSLLCCFFLSLNAQNKKELRASLLRLNESLLILKSDSVAMTNTIAENKATISKNMAEIEKLKSFNETKDLNLDKLNKLISVKENVIDGNAKSISLKENIIDSLKNQLSDMNDSIKNFVETNSVSKWIKISKKESILGLWLKNCTDRFGVETPKIEISKGSYSNKWIICFGGECDYGGSIKQVDYNIFKGQYRIKFINDNDMAGDGSQDEIIFYHEADKLFIVRHPSINYYGIDQIYEWNKCRRDELNFE